MSVRFKIGERVRFLHENQEGVVQAILGNNMLEILVDDFLELEVSTNEVVKIHAEETTLLAPDQDEEAEKPKPENRKVINAPPSLVVLRKPSKDYEFWVTNESSDEIAFTVYIRIRDKYQGINTGTVPPHEKLYLGKLTSEDFHRANLISIQMLRFPHAGRIRPIPPFSMEINCKKEIFNKISTTIPALGSLGWEFYLEEKKSVAMPKSDFIRIREEDKPIRQRKPPVVYDLHIDKLVRYPTRVDSRTMLLTQMEHFEKYMSEARMAGEDQIVFIHGVGIGALKREIRRQLKEYDFVKKFSSADPIEYGNGATLVELK